jgi:ankyrin repeat protein
VAAKAGYVETVASLLTFPLGRATINAPTEDGATPLILAVRSAAQATANVLVSAGAEVNAVDTGGRRGLTVF